MKPILLIIIIFSLVSCSDDKGNKPENTTRNERDWMDDYDEIISGLELKIENPKTSFNQREIIIIKPVFYSSGQLITKNDTVSGEVFSNYDIRYTIDKKMNLDSVFTDSAYKYFKTDFEHDIIIEKKLTKGSHYLSINCQLNSDAGFNKQIRKEITIK